MRRMNSRISFKNTAALSALALAAAVLATGFAATASAAPTGASKAPAGGHGHGHGHMAPAIFSPAAGAEKVTVTSHFIWRPTTTNSTDDSTFIDNGATNQHKKDLLFVTLNLSPGGVDPCPCLLQPIPAEGVWYDTTSSRWAIFNEDGSNMGQLTAFNVLVVPKASKSAFSVHATSSNSSGDYVIINSPLTNGHPNALIQVTQNYEPSSVSNPHTVGVRYFKVRRRWAIFNEDGAAMAHKASFNVLIGNAVSNGGKAALLTATAANKTGDAVLISNPETNGNPNNIVFATQDFNPGDKGGTGDSTNVVAAYDNSKEALINWAGGNVPLKASFNLLIYGS
jgi:hypothetical protein